MEKLSCVCVKLAWRPSLTMDQNYWNTLRFTTTLDMFGEIQLKTTDVRKESSRNSQANLKQNGSLQRCAMSHIIFFFFAGFTLHILDLTKSSTNGRCHLLSLWLKPVFA